MSLEPDTLLKILEDSLEALVSEESSTEQEFGSAKSGEHFYERSEALRERLHRLKAGTA